MYTCVDTSSPQKKKRKIIKLRQWSGSRLKTYTVLVVRWNQMEPQKTRFIPAKRQRNICGTKDFPSHSDVAMDTQHETFKGESSSWNLWILIMMQTTRCKSTAKFTKTHFGREQKRRSHIYPLPPWRNQNTWVVRFPGYRSGGPGFNSGGYKFFWDVVGLERGPLSLVRISEELFQGNSDSGLENRN
jgi:hypothetical protein